MGAILIRNVDDSLKQALRVQAAKNGRSMEEEARILLNRGVHENAAGEESFYVSFRRCVEQFGGVEIPLPERELPGEPIDFGR
ncbi:MAG: hypothetical protein U5J83_11695 [Bryobacterales bacterium]|nr:hypothetical protein [Bryobacterales bacterium]